MSSNKLQDMRLTHLLKKLTIFQRINSVHSNLGDMLFQVEESTISPYVHYVHRIFPWLETN